MKGAEFGEEDDAEGRREAGVDEAYMMTLLKRPRK